MIGGDESYLPEHPLNRRNPDRIDESQIRTNRQESIDEILKLISEIWHKNPDLRLCQLIGNCFIWRETDLYYVEDNILQDKLIDKYLDGKE